MMVYWFNKMQLEKGIMLIIRKFELRRNNE